MGMMGDFYPRAWAAAHDELGAGNREIKHKSAPISQPILLFCRQRIADYLVGIFGASAMREGGFLSYIIVIASAIARLWLAFGILTLLMEAFGPISFGTRFTAVAGLIACALYIGFLVVFIRTFRRRF
jgi:hypothetical protein